LVDFNGPQADLEAMFGLGATELLIILVIVILIFGATRLPQIGRGLGEGIKNFRGALKEPTAIDVTPKDSEAAKSEAKRDA
jgi:sec-independent protein translocase protein TatA